MTTKKATETDAPASAQSPAARRDAEARLQALIDAFAPEHSTLVATVRRWLRKHLPTAHEVVYEYRDAFVVSYAPNARGYEGVFALHGSASGVLLYFNQGKGLPDPAKLLHGSGKQTRSVPIASPATLARPELAELVAHALARNPVPYPPDGRGSIVVRSTAAAQRRQPTFSKDSP